MAGSSVLYRSVRCGMAAEMATESMLLGRARSLLIRSPRAADLARADGRVKVGDGGPSGICCPEGSRPFPVLGRSRSALPLTMTAVAAVTMVDGDPPMRMVAVSRRTSQPPLGLPSWYESDVPSGAVITSWSPLAAGTSGSICIVQLMTEPPAADPTAGTTVPPCSTHGVVENPPDGDAVTVTLTVLVAAGCGFAVTVLVTVIVLTVVLVPRKA